MNETDTAKRAPFLSFAPPLLGPEPVRMALVAPSGGSGADVGLVAVNKPAGIALETHPLEPEKAPVLLKALHAELKRGKPQLQALGFQHAAAVCGPGTPETGATLLATTRAAQEAARNAYGSDQCTLTFHILAREGAAFAHAHTARQAAMQEPASKKNKRPGSQPIEVFAQDHFALNLPIAKHSKEKRALVSHTTGKKSRTVFKRLAAYPGTYNRLKGFALWEATTTLARPHQVRLHAFEAGLDILGEALYLSAEAGEALRLKHKGHRARPGKEHYAPHLMVHLASILTPLGNFEAPYAKIFKKRLTQLETAA